MNNYVKLTVPATTDNEPFIRNTIASFCAELNPSVEVIGDIKTAVSEAVSNCIVHAYQNKNEGEIDIYAEIVKNCLYLSITDRGCGILDVEKALEPHFTTAEDKERAGIGFTIMNAFMDELSVTSNLSNGTTVKMSKNLV